MSEGELETPGTDELPDPGEFPNLSEFNILFNMDNFSWSDNGECSWAAALNLTDVSGSGLDILRSHNVQIFVITFYAIIILFGFIGNLLIVIVIIKNKHLHSVTNIFIANLALSDIVLCSFNLPFQLHYQLTEQWAFGSALCRVIMPTFGVPLFTSSLSMLMIAIDRYILIVYPFRPKLTVKTSLIIIAVIIAFTVSVAIPLMVYTEQVIVDQPEFCIYKVLCTERRWKSLVLKKVYTITVFLIQFLLPLLATSFFYCRIYLVLKQRPLKKNENRKNQKTTRILLSIVLLFTVVWLPWNLFSLTAEFDQHAVTGRYFLLTDLMLKIFAMSSACINPFLYGWLNDNFRKEFDVLCRRRGRCHVRKNGYTYTVPENSKTDFDKFTTAV